MSTYETFFSVRVKGLVRNPCYETSFQSGVKGSVRNHGYGTFLLISWNGLVRNSLYETFWPFSGKGCVLNLVYETIFYMHQVEVPCETVFLRNEKRILPCAQVKFLFRFRENPFFLQCSLVFRLKYSETRFFGCSVPVHFVRQFEPLNLLPNLVYRTLIPVFWIKANFFSVFAVRNWCIQQLWHILQKIYLKNEPLSPKYFVWKLIVFKKIIWHAIYD